MLSAFKKTYFLDFEQQWPTRELANPHYMEAFVEYIGCKQGASLEEREAMEEEKLEALERAEQVVVNEICKEDGDLDLVKEFSWHFTLKESMKASLKRDQDTPEEGVLCIWLDFQDCH